MKRLLGSSIVMAVVAVFSLVGAPAAHAAAAGAAVGTGTINPGLTASPQDTDVTFDGTAAGVIGTDAGTCAIHFDGGGTGETLAVGNGGGDLSCDGASVLGAPVSVDCGVSYDRVGVVVLVSGGCTGNAPGALTAACVFIPTNPAGTTYALACAFAIL